MTEDEFEDRLRKLGFTKAGIRCGLTERWDYFAGGAKWLTRAEYLNAYTRRTQIRAVERALGIIEAIPESRPADPGSDFPEK